MDSLRPFVSIIIPCYNAEIFIAATINSVLNQTFQNFEIIIVNDGSTDNSEAIIKKINDSRIIYISKINTGVSDSRNKGFERSKGNYILFLDADDILAPSFLESRVSTLEQNRSVGFCCSYVIKIDEHGNHLPSRRLKGVTTEIMKDVLSYDSEVITCPSNYLFRRSILDANSLRFNTELSSSADRYFLIETAMYSTGELINESAYLYYRVHKESMSNKFTSHLLQDNLLFQKKILEMNNIPKDLKKEFCYKTNYIFAGSYFKLREFMPCLWFTVKAFYFNPPKFVSQLINRK